MYLKKDCSLDVIVYIDGTNSIFYSIYFKIFTYFESMKNNFDTNVDIFL